MTTKRAEDHFTTGLIVGVLAGLVLGYAIKVIEFKSQGAVTDAAGTQQLVDRF